MTKLHFLDSGAHSLINKTLKHGSRINWEAYKTQEFWDYVDSYAEFIKKWGDGIDYYANVDAIRNPKISWKVQRYMEDKHGLSPIPVVHYNTDMRWLDKYLTRGHKYIALGGPIKRQGSIYHLWCDKAFNVICGNQARLPACKVHGFAVTTHKHIVRYPWYSVDSVTWKKMSYYGQILVPPQKVSGGPNFAMPNTVIFIDPTSTKYTTRGEGRGRHFLHLSPGGQRWVREWLEMIDVPFGKSKSNGSIIQPGVINENAWRCAATIKYFLYLAKSLPKWPWPFERPDRPSLLELFG